MKFCCVTPVLNAEGQIEITMRSVLTQTYLQQPGASLHYIIQDGLSTDGTAGIARRVAAEFAGIENLKVEVISEKDRGLYDAVSRGFEAISPGDVYCYQNAGDFYSPQAFEIVAEIFTTHDVQFLTGLQVVYNTKNQIVHSMLPYRYDRNLMLKGYYNGKELLFLQQETTFWTAALQRAIDFEKFRAFKLAGDYYLWRTFIQEAPLLIVFAWLSGWKWEPDQLSQRFREEYLQEFHQQADRRSILDGFEARIAKRRWGWSADRKKWHSGDIIMYSQEQGRYYMPFSRKFREYPLVKRTAYRIGAKLKERLHPLAAGLGRAFPSLARQQESRLNQNQAKAEAKRAFSDPSRPPVLVYQMGKVGSITVHTALQKAGIPNPVLHLHLLSDDIHNRIAIHKAVGFIPLPYHVELGLATREQLALNPGCPVKVITLVRDPIAFLVSTTFHSPQFVAETITDAGGAIDPELARRYLEHRLADPDAFEYVEGWFDRELKGVFGIDVFATPFPVTDGYAQYRQGDVEALLIRTEDLSEQGGALLTDFLGLARPLPLAAVNVRAELEDAQAYREVLQNIRLDPDLCREIYSRKLTRHFYSPGMIDALITRWSGGRLKKI